MEEQWEQADISAHRHDNPHKAPQKVCAPTFPRQQSVQSGHSLQHQQQQPLPMFQSVMQGLTSLQQANQAQTTASCSKTDAVHPTGIIKCLDLNGEEVTQMEEQKGLDSMIRTVMQAPNIESLSPPPSDDQRDENTDDPFDTGQTLSSLPHVSHQQTLHQQDSHQQDSHQHDSNQQDSNQQDSRMQTSQQQTSHQLPSQEWILQQETSLQESPHQQTSHQQTSPIQASQGQADHQETSQLQTQEHETSQMQNSHQQFSQQQALHQKTSQHQASKHQTLQHQSSLLNTTHQQTSPQLTPQCKKQAIRQPLSEQNTLTSCKPIAMKLATTHVTLPNGFRYMFADREGKQIIGVKASRVIEMGEKFGPYKGILLDEAAGLGLGSTWEICVRGRVRHYVDGRNKLYNNWLFHINVANTRDEQNLEAFQSYGDIYFRALDTIQPGTELRVFYCKEYRQKIGCDVRLEDLRYDKVKGNVQCGICWARHKTSKDMLRHMKLAHKEEITRLAHEGAKRDALPEYSNNIMDILSSDDMDFTSHLHTRMSGLPPIMVNNAESSSNVILVDGSHDLNKDGRGKAYMHAAGISQSQLQQQQQQQPPARENIETLPTPRRGKQNYVCNVCDRVFPSRGKLKAHLPFHKNSAEDSRSLFGCGICDFVCETSQALIRHNSSHVENTVKCELCGRAYHHKTSWFRHMISVHKIKRSRGRYVCVGCGLASGQVDVFRTHIRVCTHQQGRRKGTVGLKRVSSSVPEHITQEDEVPGLSSSVNDGNVGMGVAVYQVNQQADDILIEQDEMTGQSYISDPSEQGRILSKIPGEELAIGDPDENWIEVLSEDQGGRKDGARKRKQRKLLRKMASLEGLEIPGQTQTPRAPNDMIGLRNSQVQCRNPHKCSYCGMTYSNAGCLQDHILQKHISSGSYKCSHCPYTFNHPNKLTLHMRRHSNNRPYKCKLCPRTFSSENALKNHHSEHTDAKPFKCEPCFKAFKSLKNLVQHNNSKHKGRVKNHACSKCGKKFLEPNHLRRHELRHLGIRPFKCEICEKAYTSKYARDNHMVTHTGEKPFQCNVCGKRFALNYSLDLHSFTHKKGHELNCTLQNNTAL